MKWRPVQRQQSGEMVPYQLEFRDLVDLRNVYDSSLDSEYLFEIVRAIDIAYLDERMKHSRTIPARPEPSQ